MRNSRLTRSFCAIARYKRWWCVQLTLAVLGVWIPCAALIYMNYTHRQWNWHRHQRSSDRRITQHTFFNHHKFSLWTHTHTHTISQAKCWRNFISVCIFSTRFNAIARASHSQFWKMGTSGEYVNPVRNVYDKERCGCHLPPCDYRLSYVYTRAREREQPDQCLPRQWQGKAGAQLMQRIISSTAFVYVVWHILQRQIFLWMSKRVDLHFPSL